MGLASGQSFYSLHVRPLLDAMSVQFKAATEKLNSLVGQAPSGSHRFLKEIYDSAHVTQKRAEFVLAVYDSLWQEKSVEWRKSRFNDAVVFLKEASETIKAREADYRVPLDRIAGWGRNTNPTRSVSTFRVLSSPMDPQLILTSSFDPNLNLIHFSHCIATTLALSGLSTAVSIGSAISSVPPTN